MKALYTLGLFVAVSFLSSCQYLEDFQERAEVINSYEKKALYLARENRELKAEINRLQFEMDNLEAHNRFLHVKLEKLDPQTKTNRDIANVSAVVIDPQNDLVKQEVYQWNASQLLSIGQEEFKKKNFIKSAQYFQTYLSQEKYHKTVDDEILFQAGVAAFESGKYYLHATENLSRLIEKFPTSPYYRGAKLWMALSKFKMGKTEEFYSTVEEFRRKYKNTPEWEILRAHYENITQKYKRDI